MFWLGQDTVYWMRVFHLFVAEGQFAFCLDPSAFAGRFFSGGRGISWMRAALEPLLARMRICGRSAPSAPLTSTIPWPFSPWMEQNRDDGEFAPAWVCLPFHSLVLHCPLLRFRRESKAMEPGGALVSCFMRGDMS